MKWVPLPDFEEFHEDRPGTPGHNPAKDNSRKLYDYLLSLSPTGIPTREGLIKEAGEKYYSHGGNVGQSVGVIMLHYFERVLGITFPTKKKKDDLVKIKVSRQTAKGLGAEIID
jgi:hypothetical protein